MIILAGTAEFATREGRDACLATSSQYQEPARTGEPGCLAYYFCPDPVVDTRMVVWELWADEASLAAHFTHPNYINMGRHFGEFDFLQGNFKKYRVDKVSDVYDETFTPRADFFGPLSPADGRSARPQSSEQHRHLTDVEELPMTAAENPSTTPWHLRDNWAPVHDEITATEMVVEGVIPPELDGLYVRTGPNPRSGTSPHWFFGDGMLHGVRLRWGRAEWYRNRYVQTPNITAPLDDPTSEMGDLTRGLGNTHVVAHGGRLLALDEAHWPWSVNGDLDTIGYENFAGALTCSMTAHPKICPETGELLAFSYFAFEQPYLHYVRIGADGVVRQLEGIEIPNIVMMHDFNVTRSHVVFMDLPVVFDLASIETGLPFKFDRDAGARLGVLPRDGSNADVRWFEIDPCYVFHPVNAHDDGDRIVLHVSRQPEAFGAHADDYAEVGRLWKWVIDLTTGTVTEELVDDRPGDFGRVDDRRVGLDARYGYLMAMDGEGVSEEPIYGSALWKYDLRSGACSEHHLGAGVRGSEPVFAPAGPDAGEDEGWVVTIVHDTTSDRSKLIVVDAQDFSRPPVATVHLPRRVPYGAHGSWVPAGALST